MTETANPGEFSTDYLKIIMLKTTLNIDFSKITANVKKILMR
jgi:hypothetical protein